jgi:hypothetical protein
MRLSQLDVKTSDLSVKPLKGSLATQSAESQVRFLMGWVRSEDPAQRCRTVLATNPPLSPEGLWFVKMFAPWLDPGFRDRLRPANCAGSSPMPRAATSG